jgi:transposase
MHRGPHPTTPKLTDADHATLTTWTRRRTTAQALALRARIVLESANHPEASNTQIAQQLGVCRETARRWRERFIRLGPDGLLDAPRPGAPRTINDEQVERVLSLTLETLPQNATHWSTRSMAATSGLSQTAISRIWRAFGLRPHLSESFKLSTDPLFIEKVRDIVGLYLSPPDRALVLCVDEKPQIQALERDGHSFPTLPGQTARCPHDYVRHGTTTLFAALDAKLGTVIGECQPRHRSREFKMFLETVNAAVPADLEVHLIMDNYGTHKTQLIRDWLVKHPRYHVHFTPTSGSWLNLVECWFALLSKRRLERGCFSSVLDLERAIREYIGATNEAPRPFVWSRTADEILASVARFCQRISNSLH